MKKHVKILIIVHIVLIILSVVGTGLEGQINPESIFSILLGLTFSFFGLMFLIKILNKGKEKGNELVQKGVDMFEKNLSEIQKLQEGFRLEVVVFDELENYIKKNEKKIVEKDEKKLHDFIKLTKYLKSIKSEIDSNLNKGQTDFYLIKENLLKLIRDTKFLNSKLEQIYILGQLMVEKYVNEEMVEFYTIYEKFDELGTFNTSYENKMLLNLNNISSQLDSIQGSLNYSNVLLTYNTLQLRSIKKSLSK